MTASQLAARAQRLAGVLPAASGPVALLLPDSPGLIAATFAVLRQGGRPLLLDPAAGREAQSAALERSGAALLLTFDLRALLDRALALVAERPELRVGLLRASEELPFPRNLLEPLLRGGRFGQRPAHPGFFRLTRGDAPAPEAAEMPGAAGDARLLLSDGERRFAELLPAPPSAAGEPGRKREERQVPDDPGTLPLHGGAGFAALLACLEAGGCYRIRT